MGPPFTWRISVGALSRIAVGTNQLVTGLQLVAVAVDLWRAQYALLTLNALGAGLTAAMAWWVGVQDLRARSLQRRMLVDLESATSMKAVMDQQLEAMQRMFGRPTAAEPRH